MRPKPRQLATVIWAGALTLAVACGDDTVEPIPPLEFSLNPDTLWGAGDITLTSAEFASLELEPALDSAGEPIEYRWANFAVLLDSIVLDSWRVDDTTLAAAVRSTRLVGTSVMSGKYPIVVEVPDREVLSAELELLGIRRIIDLYPYGVSAFHLPLPWRGGRVIAFSPRNETASEVEMIDLASGQAAVIGTVSDQTYSDIMAPGPSYDPDRVVLDLTDGLGVAVSYGVAGILQPGDTLSCAPSPPNAPYLAVEVGPGACLGWYFDPSLPGGEHFWANGIALDKAPHAQFATFRISPNGSRIVFTVDPGCRIPPDTVTSWWVFDDTPAVAYTLGGVGCLTGASFSPNGDTLFAAVADPVVDEAVGWRVEVRNAATGALIASRSMDDRALFDVLADPVLPWLYVMGWGELWVLDRSNLETVARIPGGGGALGLSSHLLIHGGAAGTIYNWHAHHGHGVGTWEYDVLTELPD